MPTDHDDSLDASVDEILEKFGQIPDDFPKTPLPGSVSGSAPKFLAVHFNGKFYETGCSPPEVIERYEVCQNLAEQLAQKSLESKAGKRSHMSEEAILAQYLPRLIATRWVSEAEARWVIRRVAAILQWPAPATATE
jgi:hypothetical protein